MVYSRKRKYSSISQSSAGRLGPKYRGKFPKRNLRFKTYGRNVAKYLSSRVARIERTIETKEGVSAIFSTNTALPHNNIIVLRSDLLNSVNGNADPMAGQPQRIGDSIMLKGLKLRFLLQNQAERPRVFYRFMVIKSAKGDTPTRATLFKGLVGNKMIDQINTERFNIIAQKVLTVNTSNSGAWTTVNTTGVPRTENGSTQIGGVGTKIIDMWIPGGRITRKGVLQYENGGSQPKFFDYHLIALAYDWFGTPQDVNNVGAVSDGFTKMYYKDA